MKRLTYLSIAEIELLDAADYYNQKQPGMAKVFLDAIRNAEKRIQKNPGVWSFFVRPIRSVRVRPFPHRLLYREFPDRIQVVAVVHPSRSPGYWKDRLT